MGFEVEIPGVGECGDVAVGLGILEAGVEEHDGDVRFDLQGEVQCDE